MRLGPVIVQKSSRPIGTAEGCGTEFLDGFSSISRGSTPASRKDQLMDAMPLGRASEQQGDTTRLGAKLDAAVDTAASTAESAS